MKRKRRELNTLFTVKNRDIQDGINQAVEVYPSYRLFLKHYGSERVSCVVFDDVCRGKKRGKGKEPEREREGQLRIEVKTV